MWRMSLRPSGGRRASASSVPHSGSASSSVPPSGVSWAGWGLGPRSLPRALIPWLGGARRAAAAGMAAAIIAYLGYAFATEGWMMYVVALTTFVFALTYPSMNALASQPIPADAQGELQGAVAGLYSLSSIVGPPLMTQVFGHFSALSAGLYFPGAAFLTAALLTAGCAALFARALRRLAPQQTGAGRLPNLAP